MIAYNVLKLHTGLNVKNKIIKIVGNSREFEALIVRS